MKKAVSLLSALVMLISMLTVGAVVFAEEAPEAATEAVSESRNTVEEAPDGVAEAEEPEEVEETIISKRNGPEATSGNWGDYGSYTWDPDTATLTITQTEEQRYAGPVRGNDVNGFADVAETLEFDSFCNVIDFSGYSMKYLKFNGYAEWRDFVNCTNLEEVEAEGTLTGGAFIGCNNLKKFTILNNIALEWNGIPKTCVFYGPEMYREGLERAGYEYHVTDWDPCEHGQHDYQPCADYSEPTCTTAGNLHWACSRCGHEDRVEVPALGHSYDENTHQCIRCGKLDPNYGGSEDPSNPFEDVAPKTWYYNAVLWAVDRGVTKGTSETTFSPDKTCTRAEIVTFLWRAAGSPEPSISECPFVDVKAGSYYKKPVLWAVENSITAGTSETNFSPDMHCNRAQIVTFLWRYEGSKAEGDASVFTDLKPGAYYVPAVAWAVANHVTAGTSGTTFSPDKDCTRAEAVTFIYRNFKDKE